MKKYILPTLVSLAIGSPWAMAEEGQPAPQQSPTPPPAVAPTPVAPTPAAEQPTAPSLSEEMAEIRQAHRQHMQEQMEKIHQTQDPEERRRLIQEQMQEMQQVMQEMQTLLRESGAPPNAMGYGMGGPEQGFGPGGSWGGGPEQGFGPGGSWGGGPEQGFGPGMGMGRSRHGMMPNMPRHKDQQSHWSAMEKSLANIEKMLEKLVANQPN